ncbi:hypothetical protein K505DRAFT_41864 [Melanomma pulvis-pyrius CBS 109.77]|uniref:Uncharacterized protein n=1 Tax=Melanomma pulvis-pyrius CBS 109.77 TaxID=1314802 RepID=A0A6A6XA98_9PLEO|nr:hypothetical protein K505DRAFT_41864 [Melanomma pulvis-pyrius CBS 109.77]
MHRRRSSHAPGPSAPRHLGVVVRLASQRGPWRTKPCSVPSPAQEPPFTVTVQTRHAPPDATTPRRRRYEWHSVVPLRPRPPSALTAARRVGMQPLARDGLLLATSSIGPYPLAGALTRPRTAHARTNGCHPRPALDVSCHPCIHPCRLHHRLVTASQPASQPIPVCACGEPCSMTEGEEGRWYRDSRQQTRRPRLFQQLSASSLRMPTR